VRHIEKLETQSGCGIPGVLKLALGIKNCLPIIHGPMSCQAGYRFIPLLAGAQPLIITTGITDVDLVKGTVEKLREAIEKSIKTYHPEMIVVILTCATSLISEDYSYILQDFVEQVPIFVVDGSGISSDETQGFEDLYREIYAYFENPIFEDDRDEGLPVIGLSPVDFNMTNDIQALKSLIEVAFKKEVSKVLFHDSTLADINRAFSAQRKILLGHSMDSFHCAPFGVVGTREWIEGLAADLDLPVEQAFYDYIDLWNSKISPVKLKKKVGKAAVVGEPWWAVGLSIFVARELSIDTVLVTQRLCDTVRERIAPLSIQYLEELGNYELISKLREIHPQIVFGNSYISQLPWQPVFIPFSQPIWEDVQLDKSLLGPEGAQHLLKIVSP
jgi:nitrogenase molybdenum-iron protein alpha/beta subunit